MDGGQLAFVEQVEFGVTHEHNFDVWEASWCCNQKKLLSAMSGSPVQPFLEVTQSGDGDLLIVLVFGLL